MEPVPDLLHQGCYLLRAKVADAALMGVVHFLPGDELASLDVKSDLLVGIAERHPFACQTVHFFYGEHEVVARVIENVFVHFESRDDVGCHLQAFSQFLESRQEDLLDDLQVAEVAAGQIVHDEGDLLRQSLQLVALGARELKDVGVLLVRHNAGTCGAFFRKLDEAEVLAVEEAGVEGKLAHSSRYACKCEGDIALRLATPHLGIDDIVVERIEAE